jgi:hypothetical protein
MNTINITLSDYVNQERIKLFVFELSYGYRSTQAPEMYPPHFPPNNEGVWDEQFYGFCEISILEAFEGIPAEPILEHLIMELQVVSHVVGQAELSSHLPDTLQRKLINREVTYIQTLVATLVDTKLPQLSHVHIKKLPSLSAQAPTSWVSQYIESTSQQLSGFLIQ